MRSFFSFFCDLVQFGTQFIVISMHAMLCVSPLFLIFSSSRCFSQSVHMKIYFLFPGLLSFFAFTFSSLKLICFAFKYKTKNMHPFLRKYSLFCLFLPTSVSQLQVLALAKIVDIGTHLLNNNYNDHFTFYYQYLFYTSSLTITAFHLTTIDITRRTAADFR